MITVTGWHYRMNHRAGQAGLGIYRLWPLLRREAELVHANVAAEDLQRDERAGSSGLDARLQELGHSTSRTPSRRRPSCADAVTLPSFIRHRHRRPATVRSKNYTTGDNNGPFQGQYFLAGLYDAHKLLSSQLIISLCASYLSHLHVVPAGNTISYMLHIRNRG